MEIDTNPPEGSTAEIKFLRFPSAFYMPAITAKRYNPVIKAFCERLKAAGKPTMLIIGAAIRKRIHIIYAN